MYRSVFSECIYVSYHEILGTLEEQQVLFTKDQIAAGKGTVHFLNGVISGRLTTLQGKLHFQE